MLNKGIVFIGGGNMAEGIIRGMVNNQVADSANIRVYDVIQERMDYLNDTYGVVPVTDIKAAVKGCDIIFIAVRPQDIESVSVRIKNDITADKVIVSICAGIDLKKLADLFGSQSRLARVMPNTLIEARHGFSGICIGENMGEEDKATVSAVFSAIGQTMFINESLFNAFTAYSCAGPAYIMYFINAMIDAGVQCGFSRKDAAAITLENMIGSSMMVTMTGKHPYQITDAMTSPAGVTIEGLYELNKTGFNGIVMSCVKKAVNKSF